jgi:LAO/AO transport system kinase
LSRQEYIDGILNGDRTVLARAITLVESARPEDADLAQDVIEACLPQAGDSIRVGMTGAPGVGKSSVIEALGTYLTHELKQKVAVLAIDPSSQISGGSILGDKTRMNALANDERAFIRPSPSGGSLGGVARRTRETMLLCEAAGWRNIIVETVGVGQSETAVRSMVDFFLLLMVAGAGDEMQGMKRGIIEMSDLIAVNKADGPNRRAAEQTCRQYESALRLFPDPPTGWTRRALTCSAVTCDGIPNLWQAVLEQDALMKSNGWFQRIRRDQVRRWMHETIEWGLREHFQNDPVVKGSLPQLEREVVEGRLSPFRAAQRLLEFYKKSAADERR